MTADIRAVAEAEVRKSAGDGNPISGFGVTKDIAFIRGAVWGAARVTPTREQIQERMQSHHFDECVFDGGVRTNWWFAKCSCGWEGPESAYPSDAHDAFYVHAAEQVAALMAGLAEEGSSAQTSGEPSELS